VVVAFAIAAPLAAAKRADRYAVLFNRPFFSSREQRLIHFFGCFRQRRNTRPRPLAWLQPNIIGSLPQRQEQARIYVELPPTDSKLFSST
jgi:hypothetical protein